MVSFRVFVGKLQIFVHQQTSRYNLHRDQRKRSIQAVANIPSVIRSPASARARLDLARFTASTDIVLVSH